MHEEDLVVIGDVEVCREVGLGLVDDVGSKLAAMGVLCDAEAGALVVDERLGGLLEDVESGGARAGAEVRDVRAREGMIAVGGWIEMVDGNEEAEASDKESYYK